MRIGIVGAGKIAPYFLKSAALVENVVFEAICAVGMDERLKELKDEFNINRTYVDYDEMLKEANMDTVYIAVPNHLHYGMAKKALEAGYHVILEKPFTITSSEAVALFDLAEKNNRFIFEAITVFHSPNYKKAKEIILQMPEIKIVYLNYTQYSSRYDAFKAGEILPAFDYSKGGGAVRDINVYNIHFVVGIFGMPKQIHYYPNIVNGVDVSGTLILTYDHFVCTLIGSKDCANHAEIRVQGDKNMLLSSAQPNRFENFTYISNKKSTDYDLAKVKEALYYEMVDFEKAIRENDIKAYEECKNQTLNVMRVVEKALQK